MRSQPWRAAGDSSRHGSRSAECSTLNSRFAQQSFERAGWRLIGIAPGYDREMIEPGIVMRVYEAIYAKVLVPDSSLLLPKRHDLTPRTQMFFDAVFAQVQQNPLDTSAVGHASVC